MGKARPWILWAAIPFGISAVLLFTAPSLSPMGKIIYAFITYNLAFNVIYAAQDTPYAALMPLMTSNQHERTMLSITRMILANCGIILSYVVTLPLVRFLGGGPAGWQRAFILFGTVATILLLVCFAFTKERIKPATARSGAPIKASIASLARNKYIVLLMVTGAVYFMSLGFYGANVYYCRYFLHNAERFGPLMTMTIVAQVAGMTVVGPIVSRFGKRNSVLVGIGVSILGQLVMYIAPTSYLIVAIGTVIKGLGASPMIGTTAAMISEAIDYGEWQSGFRVDGLTFGAISLFNKSFVGIGGAMIGWILSWGGYVAGAATQSPAAMSAIRAMFLHVPLALYILTGIILSFYTLERNYKSINAELEMRRASSQAG
jgi:GPH family glycoside/pentoside/hexuronide:cation symporter